jgi:hypothetical protein
MRFWYRLAVLETILGLVTIAGAQSPPFRVKPSEIDTTLKDPGKEPKDTRTPVTTQRSNGSATSRNLQSVERQTAKINASSKSNKKITSAGVRPEKNTATPKIDIKGSGAPKTVTPQTRAATSSYKGRLKQKGSHNNSYNY